MQIKDSVDVNDSLGMHHSLILKDLETISILPVHGGKLIIKKLDENPPINCGWNDGCPELAEFLVLALDYSDETLVAYHCQKHHEDTLDNVMKELPFFIVH